MGQLSIFGEVKNGAIHQNNIRNWSFLNLILLNLQWYGLIPDNLGSNSDDRLKKKLQKMWQFVWFIIIGAKNVKIVIQCGKWIQWLPNDRKRTFSLWLKKFQVYLGVWSKSSQSLCSRLNSMKNTWKWLTCRTYCFNKQSQEFKNILWA